MGVGSSTKICSEVACGKLVRARGLCSTHYNQARYTPEQRHAKVIVGCGWCGASCQKNVTDRYAKRFCSLGCRAAWLRTRSQDGLSGEALVEAAAKARATRMSRAGRARAKIRKAARGTRGTRWVCGTCERCGQPFVSAFRGDAGCYCSNTCKRRASSSRRRARMYGAVHERYSRASIFERDKWRCHICKRMTLRARVVPHPRAPVVDHLLPLAMGGADTAANVATACFLCNSIKGARGGGEQLALIG